MELDSIQESRETVKYIFYSDNQAQVPGSYLEATSAGPLSLSPTSTIYAWGYSSFGSILWNSHGKLCKKFWSEGIKLKNPADMILCKNLGSILSKLEPMDKNMKILKTKLNRCSEKIAFVDKDEVVKEILARMNKPGKSVKYVSGDSANLRISQPIFWAAGTHLYRTQDLHLQRLKRFVEMGIYNYMKSLMNPINEVLRELDTNVDSVVSLNFESNIVTIFYVYLFCNGLIVLAALFYKAATVMFIAIRVTLIMLYIRYYRLT